MADDQLVCSLQRAGLLEADQPLTDALITALASRVKADRVGFLASLKERGMTLGARQALANAIGHAARGKLDSSSSSEDDALALNRLLLDGDREGAHALLKSQGVSTVGDRQRIIGAVLNGMSPSRALAAPSKPARRFASASEAIGAGQVALVTLTNTGYLPYTANCVVSLDIVGEQLPLTVYCADSASLERLAADDTPGAHRRPPILVPMHEEALGTFLSWKEKGWDRMMWLKCEAMRRALSTHE